MVSGSDSEDGLDFYRKAFEASHKREFGFNFEARRIIVDNVRVRTVGNIEFMKHKRIEEADNNESPQSTESVEVWYDLDG